MSYLVSHWRTWQLKIPNFAQFGFIISAVGVFLANSSLENFIDA